MRSAFAGWYNNRSLNSLINQVTKYQARDGWSHRDLLRLAHVTPKSSDYSKVFQWVTNRDEVNEFSPELLKLEVAHRLLSSTDKKEVIGLIKEHDAVRELIPTQFLGDPDVWSALLPSMPLEALTRNLGKISSTGIADRFSDAERLIVQKLNQENIKASKLHPMKILVANKVYSQGHGEKGSLTWEPNEKILEALDNAFYMSFDNVEPTGKNIYVAVDISGSMRAPLGGNMAGISSCMAAAAMAMTFVKTEPNTHVMGFADKLTSLGFNKNISLDEAVRRASNRNFGNTDCGIMFKDAETRKLPIDAFVVITDNETNSNRESPVKTLRHFRKVMGRDTKLVVIGTATNEISIADPNDNGMLDVAGMDTSVPSVMFDFIRG